MPNRERRKGLEGEREVAEIWRKHGFDVRGLEGEGDHLAILDAPTAKRGSFQRWPKVIHSEVKRQNRLRTEWVYQAEREAPAGVVPVVSWRPDGGRWWAMIPLDDLARLLA